jgi:hypothetical protein
MHRDRSSTCLTRLGSWRGPAPDAHAARSHGHLTAAGQPGAAGRPSARTSESRRRSTSLRRRAPEPQVAASTRARTRRTSAASPACACVRQRCSATPHKGGRRAPAAGPPAEVRMPTAAASCAWKAACSRALQQHGAQSETPERRQGGMRLAAWPRARLVQQRPPLGALPLPMRRLWRRRTLGEHAQPGAQQSLQRHTRGSGTPHDTLLSAHSAPGRLVILTSPARNMS